MVDFVSAESETKEYVAGSRQAEELLAAIFGDAPCEQQQVCFALFRQQQPPVYLFGHEGEWDLSGVVADATKGDVYFSLAMLPNSCSRHRRGKAIDAKAIGCLWADIDFKDASEAAVREFIDSLPLQPSAIVNSGNGLHLYWLLNDIWLLDDQDEHAAAAALLKRWVGALKTLAAPYGVTPDSVSDLARILRVPGTLNHKDPDDLKPVTLEELDTDRRYTRQQFEDFVDEHCPQTAEPERNASPLEVSGSLSSVADIGCGVAYEKRLERARAYAETLSPSIQGCKGSDAALWAARVFSTGFALNRHDAMQLMHEFNMRSEPPWSDRDLERKLDEVERIPFSKPPGWLVEDNDEWESEFHLTDEQLAAVDFSGLLAGLKGTDGASASGHDLPEESEWDEPQEIPSGLAPVKPFDVELLPQILRPWVQDIARRMQSPIDFVASAAMVALSSVVGRRLGIFPKQRDNWCVVPNLWGLCIAKAGYLKSPTLNAALKPLHSLEDSERRAYDDAILAREDVLERLSFEKEYAKTESNRLAKKGHIDEAVARKRSVPAEPPEPVRRRFITNDATAEKLIELLRDNPSGLLLTTDELSGVLANMSKAGRETDRAIYLQAWAGDGRFTQDRIGRGTVECSAMCLSVIGGAQPSVIRELTKPAISGTAGDDGLIQRFQLAVWPDSVKFDYVDEEPDREAAQAVANLFERLANADFAMGYDHSGSIPSARFTPDAQPLFVEWYTECVHKSHDETEHSAMRSHLSKYPSLIPSLALLIHLADGGSGDVPESALQRAIQWGDYLESHARRMYSASLGHHLETARALVERLKNGELTNGFTARELKRKGWAGMTETMDVDNALEEVESAGWIKSKKCGNTVRYLLHPSLPASGGMPNEKVEQPPAEPTLSDRIRELLNDNPELTYTMAKQEHSIGCGQSLFYRVKRSLSGK
jgi:hypothetical protein